jgi:hypothetical protein
MKTNFFRFLALLGMTIILPPLGGGLGWGLFAQKTYPEPEEMTHAMSEFWLPQPAIVTPGDIQTDSAPSDAIVLFDGKDLSAWESAETKGAAEWVVNPDGTFTVDKKHGDIQTKQSF